jgi:hypothetical protein
MGAGTFLRLKAAINTDSSDFLNLQSHLLSGVWVLEEKQRWLRNYYSQSQLHSRSTVF